ncbi:MAG: MotA/TolQ/ExbB proton channel family protein [Planctomycetales bacterium]
MSSGWRLDRRRTQSWYALAAWCWVLALTLIPLRGSSTVWAQDEEAEETTEEEAEPAADGKPVDAKGGDAAQAPADESFLAWLYNASGPFGIMIGLESFLLVGLIITYILQLRMPVFIPPEFVEGFEQKLTAKDYQGAYELAKNDDSLLAKLLAGGLSKLSRGYDDAVTGMQQVAEDENMALDHKLSYISIIGTTAPMLGLLGTVQGMVQAFSVIARSTVSPKPSELANGITLALVTTLEGLIVAIPAIIGFALFKNRQARLVLETGMAADGLMSRFASIGKRPASTTASATAPAAPDK